MVHGKGDDAESGGSRGRCQAETRQDETNEFSIDVPSDDVKSSNGAAVGSVPSVDVPSADVACSDGAVVGFVTSVVGPSEGVGCSD